MKNVLHEAQSILMEAKYHVVPVAEDGQEYIAFENNTLFGFLHYYSTIEELLSSWKQDKDKALKLFSPKLHLAGSKAWNVYTVILTSEEANDIQFHALQDIEEDLSGTRKIARSNLDTTDDVRAALLSLLPFSYIPSLPSLDIKQEIALRAQELPKKALMAFLADEELSTIATLLESE